MDLSGRSSCRDGVDSLQGPSLQEEVHKARESLPYLFPTISAEYAPVLGTSSFGQLKLNAVQFTDCQDCKRRYARDQTPTASSELRGGADAT